MEKRGALQQVTLPNSVLIHKRHHQKGEVVAPDMVKDKEDVVVKVKAAEEAIIEILSHNHCVQESLTQKQLMEPRSIGVKDAPIGNSTTALRTIKTSALTTNQFPSTVKHNLLQLLQ
eukprot:7653946-Ditylum_brightwellii.AAC.1